jgi:hypothetical protein
MMLQTRCFAYLLPTTAATSVELKNIILIAFRFFE